MSTGKSGKPWKPRNPWPRILRRILRKILPQEFYRRHIGRHEDASLEIWRRLAQLAPPGTAILDIGAFRGEYSLAARAVNPTARVYAFEPDPSNLDSLRLACVSKNIEIVAAAVAEQDGVVRFVCIQKGEGQDSAQSHIAAEDHAFRSSSTAQEVRHVAAVALDSWAVERGVVPSLIKIDVEGAETGILRGAIGVLLESQPIILCEVLSDVAGDSVMTALPKCYRYWHIDENSGVSERSRITRKKWRNNNWVLVPERKTSLMASPTKTH